MARLGATIENLLGPGALQGRVALSVWGSVRHWLRFRVAMFSLTRSYVCTAVYSELNGRHILQDNSLADFADMLVRFRLGLLGLKRPSVWNLEVNCR